MNSDERLIFGCLRQYRSDITPERAKQLAAHFRTRVNWSEEMQNLIHDSAIAVARWGNYSDIEPELMPAYSAAEVRASLEHYFRVEAAKHDARLAKVNKPNITL